MNLRLAIMSGEVMVGGEQTWGGGDNFAARLESLAGPGGICVSGTVCEHLGNRLALSYEDLGEQSVKNIAKPVRVHRVLPEALAAEATAGRTKAQGTRR